MIHVKYCVTVGPNPNPVSTGELWSHIGQPAHINPLGCLLLLNLLVSRTTHMVISFEGSTEAPQVSPWQDVS
jgi:hypothetical protein